MKMIHRLSTHRTIWGIIILGVTVLSLLSCKKELTTPAGGSGEAQISFFCVSPQLLNDLAFTGTVYILVDRTDTDFDVSSLDPATPLFAKSYKFQYPNTTFNTTLQEPWVQYMYIQAGQHRFSLVDTARYLRIKDSIVLKPNTPISVYYADSLGYFRAFNLQDQLTSEAGKVGLRFLDFSPDAGPVFFTINEKPAGQSGFPATLQYGQTGGFVPYADTVSDTLRVNFYLAGDSTDVIARAFVQTAPGHSYTLALSGYYNPSPFYMDPLSGSYQYFTGGLSILINQNN